MTVSTVSCFSVAEISVGRILNQNKDLEGKWTNPGSAGQTVSIWGLCMTIGSCGSRPFSLAAKIKAHQKVMSMKQIDLSDRLYSESDMVYLHYDKSFRAQYNNTTFLLVVSWQKQNSLRSIRAFSPTASVHYSKCSLQQVFTTASVHYSPVHYSKCSLQHLTLPTLKVFTYTFTLQMLDNQH